MSTKRQPAKQRRQTQNQRQRAALEARRANAAASAVSGDKAAPAAAASSGGKTGSVLSRLRGATATGGTVRTTAPATGLPVGHRAALSGLLAGVAAAVVGAVLLTVPVDASGDAISTPGAVTAEWALSAWDTLQDTPGASADELVEAVEDWSPNGEQRYGQANFPVSLLLLLPLVGAGLTFRAVSRRAPAKVVNRAMYVTFFGTLLSGQMLLFLPTAVGAGIAAFQIRKYELATAVPPAEDDQGDDVIDVDEVEADEAMEDEALDESDELLEVEAAADRDDD